MDTPDELLPEQLAAQLVAGLTRYLSRYEDVESAIAVYKTACSVIHQVEEVKKAAYSLAEQDLRLQQEQLHKTEAGVAGWTHPKTPPLNRVAWEVALERDDHLKEIQRQYEQAEELLKQAQQPYMELPEPNFYIR